MIYTSSLPTLILARSLSRLSLMAALLLICAAPLSAQSGGGTDTIGTGGNNVIQGRVYLPGGAASDVRVKVRLESMDMANLSTVTDPNGAFRFSGLSGGNYTVIVDGEGRYETFREPITIDRQGNATGRFPRIFQIPVYLRLKGSSGGPETKPGTVDGSLAGVPPAALDLYNKGLDASKKGDSAGAVEHLKAAIALYPEFPLALNELGVQYLRLSQPDKAAESLRAALKINPDAFMPRLNYGIALLEKKDYAASEKELREALKRNNTSPVAHMYLGITLAKLRKLDDAQTELERAASSGRDEVNMAHYYLGGIYWSKREYKRAADELETYLKGAPNAPGAEQIRGTIKDLRAKQ